MRSADMMCEFVTLADFSPQKNSSLRARQRKTQKESACCFHIFPAQSERHPTTSQHRCAAQHLCCHLSQ